MANNDWHKYCNAYLFQAKKMVINPFISL